MREIFFGVEFRSSLTLRPTEKGKSHADREKGVARLCRILRHARDAKFSVRFGERPTGMRDVRAEYSSVRPMSSSKLINGATQRTRNGGHDLI